MHQPPTAQDATLTRPGGVWEDLVGQPHAVDLLQQAALAATGPATTTPGAVGSAMSQSWLITGPPGSGRSNAAKAFAAALECDDPQAPGSGCGACRACLTALAGTHPDVILVRTELLSIGIDQIRELVLQAAMAPTVGRWLVVIIEDADRLTEQAADALLKSIEEPPPRNVWLLCAPTVDDVTPTIRSRCRHLLLRTPTADAVAGFLVARHGVDPALALLGARCAQGHIGRARALATDQGVRARHDAVIGLPFRLTGPAAAVLAAADLVATASADAEIASTAAAARATARLRRQLGIVEGTRPDRAAQAALKEQAEEQVTMAKRAVRDHLDRALVDLAAFYRDVLATQLGAVGAAVNEHRRAEIDSLARAGRPEDTLAHIDAVLAAREAITVNGAALLAVEAMALALLPSPSAPARA